MNSIPPWYEYILFKKIVLDSTSDLEIRGFPGEYNKTYECYTSRKTSFYDGKNHDESINIYQEILTKPNEHGIIQYTHQTTAGQSGGPLLLHLSTKQSLKLIGIHVSGDHVRIFCYFWFFF